MKKLALVLTILVLPIFCFSQDMIVKKTGNKIYCRILSVDSNEITYKHPAYKESIKIKRSEVSEYHISSSAQVIPVSANSISKEVLLLSFFAGQCIPLSDFASKDADDIKAGLADEGRSFEGSAILKINSFFGLVFSYKSHTYGFDDEVVCDLLSAQFPGTTFYCSSDPWKMRGFFPGVFITFPFKTYPKLLMDFEVTAGIPKYSFPKLVTRGNPYGPNVTITTSASPVRAITACMGLGFSYRLAPVFAVNVHADYLFGNPDFDNVTTRSTNGYVDFSSYKQEVRGLNLRLGFSLIISKKENKVK